MAPFNTAVGLDSGDLKSEAGGLAAQPVYPKLGYEFRLQQLLRRSAEIDFPAQVRATITQGAGLVRGKENLMRLFLLIAQNLKAA